MKIIFEYCNVVSEKTRHLLTTFKGTYFKFVFSNNTRFKFFKNH